MLNTVLRLLTIDIVAFFDRCYKLQAKLSSTNSFFVRLTIIVNSLIESSTVQYIASFFSFHCPQYSNFPSELWLLWPLVDAAFIVSRHEEQFDVPQVFVSRGGIIAYRPVVHNARRQSRIYTKH